MTIFTQEFTHEKISYRAQCHRWDGSNTEEICKLFDDATLFREHIMIRHKHDGVGYISSLRIGDWCIIGEDKRVRTYTNERFSKLYRTSGVVSE